MLTQLTTASNEWSGNGRTGSALRSSTTRRSAIGLASSSMALSPSTVSDAGLLAKWLTHDDIRSSTSPVRPSSSYSAATAAMARSSMWVTRRG